MKKKYDSGAPTIVTPLKTMKHRLYGYFKMSLIKHHLLVRKNWTCCNHTSKTTQNSQFWVVHNHLLFCWLSRMRPCEFSHLRDFGSNNRISGTQNIVKWKTNLEANVFRHPKKHVFEISQSVHCKRVKIFWKSIKWFSIMNIWFRSLIPKHKRQQLQNWIRLNCVAMVNAPGVRILINFSFICIQL